MELTRVAARYVHLITTINHDPFRRFQERNAPLHPGANNRTGLPVGRA